VKTLKIIKKIIFALFILEKNQVWRNVKKLLMYNYIILCIIMYEQFIFYIFSNFFVSKTNNAKIIPLIIFYVFTLLLLFILY